MSETVEVRRDGMVLDLLLWERAGTTDGVEATLAANPGLAAQGVVLPLLTRVVVPDAAVQAAPVREVVRLWSE